MPDRRWWIQRILVVDGIVLNLASSRLMSWAATGGGSTSSGWDPCSTGPRPAGTSSVTTTMASRPLLIHQPITERRR